MNDLQVVVCTINDFIILLLYSLYEYIIIAAKKTPGGFSNFSFTDLHPFSQSVTQKALNQLDQLDRQEASIFRSKGKQL